MMSRRELSCWRYTQREGGGGREREIERGGEGGEGGGSKREIERGRERGREGEDFWCTYCWLCPGVCSGDSDVH